MPRILRVSIGCALLLAACNNSPDTRPPTSRPEPTPKTDDAAGPAATTATPSTPAATTTIPSTPAATGSDRGRDPEPDPITHPCVVAAAQYTLGIEQGSDACRTNADCDCYQGGIGKSGCGGVLSRKSVDKLDTIAKSFREMKCPLTTHCAPWVCKPRCEAGHCRR